MSTNLFTVSIPICIVSFTGFDFSLSNENVFITDAKNSICFKEIIKVENNGTKRNLLYSIYFVFDVGETLTV